LVERIINTISSDRFETYLVATGYDSNRALKLYFWNTKLSASFYPLLAANEVALRNIVVTRISEVFGGEWWENSCFKSLLGKQGFQSIQRAKKAIAEQDRGVTGGRLTAELSFGFWSKMLLPKYEAKLWDPIHPMFVYLPEDKGLADLYSTSEKSRTLRNRISHHEPLINRNISQEYSDSLQLLSWLCKHKHEWLKPQLETMKIMRARP